MEQGSTGATINFTVAIIIVLTSLVLAATIAHKNHQLGDEYSRPICWYTIMLIVSSLAFLACSIILFTEKNTNIGIWFAIAFCTLQLSRNLMLWHFSAGYWVLARKIEAVLDHEIYEAGKWQLFIVVGALVNSVFPILGITFYKNKEAFRGLSQTSDVLQMLSCLLLVDAMRRFRQKFSKQSKVYTYLYVLVGLSFAWILLAVISLVLNSKDRAKTWITIDFVMVQLLLQNACFTYYIYFFLQQQGTQSNETQAVKPYQNYETGSYHSGDTTTMHNSALGQSKDPGRGNPLMLSGVSKKGFFILPDFGPEQRDTLVDITQDQAALMQSLMGQSLMMQNNELGFSLRNMQKGFDRRQLIESAQSLIETTNRPISIVYQQDQEDLGTMS